MPTIRGTTPTTPRRTPSRGAFSRRQYRHRQRRLRRHPQRRATTANPDATIDEYGDLDQLGLRFAYYGDTTDDDFYLHRRIILVTAKHETDQDTVHAVDLTIPADAEQKLDWALNVLGNEPTQTQPAWLLAASFG